MEHTLLRTFGDIQNLSPDKLLSFLENSMDILDMLEESVFVTDLDGVISYCNKAAGSFCSDASIPMQDLLGIEDLWEDIFTELKEKQYWEGMLDAYTDETFHNSYNLKIKTYFDKKVMLAVITDVSEITQTKEQFEYQIYHDALTGLPNRMLFRDRLNQSLYYADRRGLRVSLLFLDIDHFKKINDTRSHAFGDKVLKQVAEIIKTAIRSEDTVCRFAGDEFLILVNDHSDPEVPVQVAKRVLYAITQPMPMGSETLNISASIGVASYPDDGNSPDELISNADVAKFRAKERGRNTFELFTQDLNRRVRRKLEIEHSFVHAFSNNEFQMYFQPKYSILRDKTVGAEALLRWNKHGLGFISPEEFIPIAEESSFILRLGEWVLEESLIFLRKMKSYGQDEFTVAINISGKQFEDAGFPGLVKQMIEAYQVKPQQVEIEITEHVMMTNLDQVVRGIKEIYDYGVSIALDDFGTGYSSLNYLQRLPIRTLKIDKSFISILPSTDDRNAVVKAIVSMAEVMKLNVVAEGVETKMQLDFLGELGCDLIQGFFYSPPLPEDNFMTFVLGEEKPIPILDEAEDLETLEELE